VGPAVIVGLLMVCVGLWLLRGALDPAAPPSSTSTPQAGVAPRPAPSTVTPASRHAIPELPSAPEASEAPEAPELHGQDTLDPCKAGREPAIPAGYATVMADGVTVAWLPSPPGTPGPYDDSFRPTAVAYLINGLLAEAAALTGTQRRERLAVIVYPSRNALLAVTHAPPWTGLYDGGAVHLVVQSNAELGVSIVTLRHEVMHAQLHVAVGCMPSWFNEGLALYFTGTPLVRQWLDMLHHPDGFDLASLEASTFAGLPRDRTERARAESLAMIVFLIEHSGELGLQGAVRTLQATAREAGPAGPGLWERLYPGAGHRALLDSLARKIFGVPPGDKLDRILKAAICCYGLREVSAFHCRGAPPHPNETIWYDDTSSPRAFCSAEW